MSAAASAPRARLAGLAVVVLAVHVALLLQARALLEPPEPQVEPARTFITRRIDAKAPEPPPQAAPAVPAQVQPPREHAPARPRPRAATPSDPPPPPAQPVSGAELGPIGPPPTAAEPAPLRAIAIPEPARLHYEVAVQARGLSIAGKAELRWRHDGSEYQARLEVSSAAGARRVQESTGLITPEGLAPLRFSDKARTETATHFERDKGKLVFSNNQPEALLVAGMQDRLSVVVQLSGMIAAAPANYPPGTTIAIPTASTREAETWLFTVEAEEQLQLPGGRLQGLKLLRLPRKEYDQKVELWLAPGLDYAPVRLRLTNPNGDSVDQRWSGTDRG